MHKGFPVLAVAPFVLTLLFAVAAEAQKTTGLAEDATTDATTNGRERRC